MNGVDETYCVTLGTDIDECGNANLITGVERNEAHININDATYGRLIDNGLENTRTVGVLGTTIDTIEASRKIFSKRD